LVSQEDAVLHTPKNRRHIQHPTTRQSVFIGPPPQSHRILDVESGDHNMAAESNGAPPSGTPAVQEGTKAAPASAPAPTNETAAAANPEKLTPAQLKAKAKAEKAARRAQVKEARAVVVTAPPTPQTGGPGADAKGGKGKGKQDGQQSQSKSGHLHAHRPSVSGRRPSMPTVEKDGRGAIPECFSHIPMAKRIPLSQAHKDVHPAVLVVGQQMATFALKDSISRLKATLLAFRKVRIAVKHALHHSTDTNGR
jgi:translation initiation factor eIF-2B subunit delta